MPTIKHRRATKSQWETENPILSSGEIGYELGTNKLKVGNGVSAWTELTYFVDEATVQEMMASSSGLHYQTTVTTPEFDPENFELYFYTPIIEHNLGTEAIALTILDKYGRTIHPSWRVDGPNRVKLWFHTAVTVTSQEIIPIPPSTYMVIIQGFPYQGPSFSTPPPMWEGGGEPPEGHDEFASIAELYGMVASATQFDSPFGYASHATLEDMMSRIVSNDPFTSSINTTWSSTVMRDKLSIVVVDENDQPTTATYTIDQLRAKINYGTGEVTFHYHPYDGHQTT